MTRDERLQWAKERALAYVDAGRPHEAFISFLCDLGNHQETRDLAAKHGRLLEQSPLTADAMRAWIEGF